MNARAGGLAVVMVLGCLVGCGPGGGEPYVPHPPPSPIPAASGWRTLGVYPDEPNPEAGYFPYSDGVNSGQWMGDLDGRVSALTCIDLNRPGISGCQRDWVSIPIDGAGGVSVVGTVWSRRDVGPLRVLDSATEFYGWQDGTELQRRTPIPPEGASETLEVVFDSTGVRRGGDPGVPPIGSANATLDIVVSGRTGLFGTPLLFVRERGATSGINYATRPRELVLARDLGSAFYGGDEPLTFDPIDGAPLLLQLGGQTYSGTTTTRTVLSLFAPTTEALDTDPTVDVLRRVDLRELDNATTLHPLFTPRRAWVLVDEGADWSLYRLDRATARLVSEWTMTDPLDASARLVAMAATDDGVVYVGSSTEGGGPSVLQITGGVATELWPSDAGSRSVTLLDLYSSGARLFVMIGDAYQFIHQPATHPVTLSHARFTFLTPDISDVPAPAPPAAPPSPEPPPSCNPVTNDGCTATEACDVGPGRNGFTCAPIGTALPCEACNPTEGPFCGVGYTCYGTSPTEGTCIRACCTDADCGGGPGGPRCAISDGVGYCASVRIDEFIPSCVGIPAVPPSGGSCGVD